MPSVVAAQEYKVESLKQAPPSSICPGDRRGPEPPGLSSRRRPGQAVRRALASEDGPATAKPAGPKGAIQFPFLQESELLGVIQLAGEGHDYRDQTIAKGIYTMRYGLQPVNGDHLGVSPFRDYSLLLPAAKDKRWRSCPQAARDPERRVRRVEPSGRPFHAGGPGAGDQAEPSMVHDEEKNTWGVVVPLSLSVKGESTPMTLPVSIILVGASEAALSPGAILPARPGPNRARPCRSPC